MEVGKIEQLTENQPLSAEKFQTNIANSAAKCSSCGISVLHPEKPSDFKCKSCRIDELERENFAQSDLIAKLEKDLSDVTKTSAMRLIELTAIRNVIKKHFPNAYGRMCVKPKTSEVLEHLFSQAVATEKGRNAFRDELIRQNYTHHDLTKLVENYQEEK